MKWEIDTDRVGSAAGERAVPRGQGVVSVAHPPHPNPSTTGRHDPDRTATRNGNAPSSVTLGGRRVPVERPRATLAVGGELRLDSYAVLLGRDLSSVDAAVVMIDGIVRAECVAKHPQAAASLREGLDQMFSVRRLGVGDRLAPTMSCTNLVESTLSVVADLTRRVKRWRDPKMVKRWVGVGMLEPNARFGQVRGGLR